MDGGMMGGLDKLCPSPITVQVGVAVVEIRELTVGQLPRFLRAAAPVLGALTREGGVDVAALLEHADALVDLIVIATGIERATAEALPASDLMPLIEALIEANAGFFGAALPSLVAKLAAKMGAMAGSTPSSP